MGSIVKIEKNDKKDFMMEKFKELIICVRAMQLYYQSAHNLVGRFNFFGDHNALGEFYIKLAKDYDKIVERGIGLFGREIAHLNTLLKGVYQKTKDLPCTEAKDNKIYFEAGLKLEEELIEYINKYCKCECVTEGTIDLLGSISNSAESRVYMLKQRLRN